jgi:hypothetical protein
MSELMSEQVSTHLGVVNPLGDYIVCHRSGPEFQGPTVGASWANGVSKVVKGYELRRFGMAHLGVIFEHSADHVATWVDGWWKYLAKEVKPAAVEPPPKKSKKRKRKKRT